MPMPVSRVSFFMGISSCGRWVRSMPTAPDHEADDDRDRGGRRDREVGPWPPGGGGGAVLEVGDALAGAGLHVELGLQLVDGGGQLLPLPLDVGLDLLRRRSVGAAHG